MSERHSLHTETVKILQKRKFAILPYQVFYLISVVITLLALNSLILTYIRYGLGYNTRLMEMLLSLFYLDREYNIPTYWSSLLLLSAALLLAYIFIQKHLEKEKYRYYWLVLAGIFLLMSMDEYMGVHERMIDPPRSYFDVGKWFYFAWVIPGIVVVGVAGLLFLRFLLALRLPIRKKFLIAAALYLGGALGVEMLSGYITYAYGQRSLHYPLTTTVEETLEMFGVAYFIYALLTYIQTALGQSMLISFRNPKVTSKISPSASDATEQEKRSAIQNRSTHQ